MGGHAELVGGKHALKNALRYVALAGIDPGRTVIVGTYSDDVACSGELGIESTLLMAGWGQSRAPPPNLPAFDLCKEWAN